MDFDTAFARALKRAFNLYTEGYIHTPTFCDDGTILINISRPQGNTILIENYPGDFVHNPKIKELYQKRQTMIPVTVEFKLQNEMDAWSAMEAAHQGFVVKGKVALFGTLITKIRYDTFFHPDQQLEQLCEADRPCFTTNCARHFKSYDTFADLAKTIRWNHTFFFLGYEKTADQDEAVGEDWIPLATMWTCDRVFVFANRPLPDEPCALL